MFLCYIVGSGCGGREGFWSFGGGGAFLDLIFEGGGLILFLFGRRKVGVVGIGRLVMRDKVWGWGD